MADFVSPQKVDGDLKRLWGQELEGALQRLREHKDVAKFIEEYLPLYRCILKLHSGSSRVVESGRDVKKIFKRWGVIKQPPQYFQIIDDLLKALKAGEMTVIPVVTFTNFKNRTTKYRFFVLFPPIAFLQNTPEQILEAFRVHDEAVDKLEKVAVTQWPNGHGRS